MRADWTRFYRQITISAADWWMSIVFADLDGPRISKSLDFGNGAGPAIAHRPMGIFLQIIHHQVGLHIAEIRAWSPDQWAASDLDGDSVLADLQTLDNWSAERRRIFTAAHPTEAADAAWLDFQCTSIVLDGFFDDSLIACLAALIPTVATVLLDTAAQIKLEAKTSKVWCGLPGNQTGQIDCDLWASNAMGTQRCGHPTPFLHPTRSLDIAYAMQPPPPVGSLHCAHTQQIGDQRLTARV